MGGTVKKTYTSQEELSALKKILLSEPSNLDVANRYWDALSSIGGHDVRSGGFLIEAYRACALASHEGVIAFARAYRELYENSGESPRRELLDEELSQALETRLSALRNHDQGIVEWILESVFRRIPPSRDSNRHPEAKLLGHQQEFSKTPTIATNLNASDLP